MTLPRGRIKTAPEDFLVEEVPLYAPSGEGDHLFVRFTKRNLTTDIAAARIAGAVSVAMRDIGIAGMKDKVAVTTQTVSLPLPREGRLELEARLPRLALDGITVHECVRHTHKLKTGHLAANRFAIVVRGIEAARLAEVTLALEEVGRAGIPNAFGPQRFGRDKNNADRARAWLSGRARPPRDARLRRLLFSALQAELFNRVLDLRVQRGTWSSPLPGDLVKRRASGGLHLWTEAEGRDRCAEGDEWSPTGPIFGVKMRDPVGEPLELEQSVLRESLGDGVDLSVTGPLGEGTRRSLRLWVNDLRVEACELSGPALPVRPAHEEEREQERDLKVSFVLPKGGYATTVLGTVLALNSPEASLEASPEAPEEATQASQRE
jgi:tRNA pseudouridine13 synthase